MFNNSSSRPSGKTAFQALTELAALLNALPTEKTVVLTVANPAPDTAAQLRAVLIAASAPKGDAA